MRQRNMKRVNLYLDEETLTLLETYKKWGKPYSFMVRYAIKQYEKARVKNKPDAPREGVDVSGPEDSVITYD